MYDLHDRVVAIVDGEKKEGWICGRTFESKPRYNVMVNSIVLKDLTDEKLVKAHK